MLEQLKSSKIIKMIPFKWRLKLKFLLAKQNVREVFEEGVLKVIVAIAADYGNLGDIAITIAQILFLQDVFPEHEIIPIMASDLYILYGNAKSIGPKDIITLIGGGNMGDMYEGLENERRVIINLFPYNKMISFPQSIDFKKEKSLEKSKKIYSKHQDLHIFAREPYSYELMKESFNNNQVYLVPDIVLYLNKFEPQMRRKGITLTLRNDIEKKISRCQQDELVLMIQKRYQDVQYYDTTIEAFKTEYATRELDHILNAYKKSRVVVTDRLHGMIFCAITKTPCIVLPNNNHKIAGTYSKWLSGLNYIVFVEHFDRDIILKNVERLYDLETQEADSLLSVRKQFKPLRDVLVRIE